MFSDRILEYLKAPGGIDADGLELADDGLRCPDTGEDFPFIGGVPSLYAPPEGEGEDRAKFSIPIPLVGSLTVLTGAVFLLGLFPPSSFSRGPPREGELEALKEHARLSAGDAASDSLSQEALLHP